MVTGNVMAPDASSAIKEACKAVNFLVPDLHQYGCAGVSLGPGVPGLLPDGGAGVTHLLDQAPGSWRNVLGQTVSGQFGDLDHQVMRALEFRSNSQH
jgi:hypothetical protein